MNFDDPDIRRIYARRAVLSDGLVLPPEEKSEAEYRAKIARGEVQHLTFAHRLYVSEPAGDIEFAEVSDPTKW